MRTLSPPPSLTKTDAACAALREAIEAGRLAPGERLAVKRLVAELQMSPTPIREALRLLQAEGLAVYKPHHGMVVADYPAESVAEVSRMRALLEPLAVELAVRRATPDQLAQIRAAHQAHGEAVRAPLRGGREPSLNAAWHQAVYRACDSRLLIDFIARLWSAVPVEAIWRSDRSEESLVQHDLIMEAIERGDAERARELMREHIEYGVNATLTRMRAGRR